MLHHLAGHRARQRVDEGDGLGALVVREARPGPVDDVPLERVAGGVAVAEGDDGLDRLAVLVVGYPDYRDVVDGGVRDQQVLDLAGVDVDASGDDRVVGAAGDEQVPVAVEVAEVAHPRPAPVVEHRGGFLRVVVVGELVGRAGEPDDAVLADRQFLPRLVGDRHRAGCHPADRAGMLQPLLRADRHVSGRLGGGVVLVDDRAEPVDHLPLDLDRARRGAVRDGAQAADVVAAADRLGQPQQPDEHRRDELGVGHPVPLDRMQRLFGVELREEDERAAVPVGGHGRHQRRGVVERADIQRHGGRVKPVAVDPEDVTRHVAEPARGVDLGVDDPLRPAGGARGVEHRLPLEFGAERSRPCPRDRRRVVVPAAGPARVRPTSSRRPAPAVADRLLATSARSAETISAFDCEFSSM